MLEQRHFGSSLDLPTNRHVSRFLLVSLNIDAILQEPTIHGRRQMLGAITDGSGLESAYGETLSRIKGQGRAKARLGIAALMWISHSERPLKADELCHALAVEIGSPNLNKDNVPSIGIVLACCQGLVAVDKEASTVRLIHFTLQGYLRAHPELFSTVHLTMAETCLSYLNSQQVRALSTSPAPDLQGTPFLEYSSVYWGVHAKEELSDCAELLASKLFDDYNSHISIRTFLKAREGWSYDIDFDKPHSISGLHFASLFGIVEIVSVLIEVEGCDIQAFQWVRASLGQPGLLVGPGWAHWAGLNFTWAWAGSGPEVPSPGNPAGLVNVLSCLPDFHHDDPSSHCHHGNQNLSTQNLGMDLPLAANLGPSRRVFKLRLNSEQREGKLSIFSLSLFNSDTY